MACDCSLFSRRTVSITDIDIYVGARPDNQMSHCGLVTESNSTDVFLNCTSPVSGRFVKLEVNANNQELYLCEVEVFGSVDLISNITGIK